MLRVMLVVTGLFVLAACTPATAAPATATAPAAATVPPTAPPTAVIEPTTEDTPRPSPLPPATDTPAPTATSAPAGTPLALPGAGHDLLFLDRGRLMRWQHAAGQLFVVAGPAGVTPAPTPGGVPVIEPVTPGSVVHYSIDAGGRFGVFAMLKSEGVYELARFDLGSGASETLLDVRAPGLLGLALSPDGKWLAYVPADVVNENVPPSGMVYLLEMAPGSAPQSVAACALRNEPEFAVGCLPPIWSPDSARLAWGDGLGLWIAEPGGEARMVVASGPSTSGQLGIEGAHFPAAFSPDGAFLLERIGYYEGSGQAVLRVADGQVELIPEADEYIQPSARLTWLDNSRLLAVRAGSVYPAERQPALEIFRVLAEGDQVLRSESTLEIPGGGNSFPVAAMTLADGRVVFPLLGSQLDAPGPSALYIADPDAGQVDKLADVPGRGAGDPEDPVIETAMAPDAALILRHYMALRYVPIDGSAAVDLRPVLGYGVDRFVWVP